MSVNNNRCGNQFKGQVEPDYSYERISLSQREQEAIGKTRTKTWATSADEMGIAQSTIETYMRRAKDKLDSQPEYIKTLLNQQQLAERYETLTDIATHAIGVQQNQRRSDELLTIVKNATMNLCLTEHKYQENCHADLVIITRHLANELGYLEGIEVELTMYETDDVSLETAVPERLG
ncbi:helix-turn-helix transcriptional regulator [Natrialbaceae archaeon A-CW3]